MHTAHFFSMSSAYENFHEVHCPQKNNDIKVKHTRKTGKNYFGLFARP